jgi:transcriptional regulator with XRE-family HTH domain
MKQTLKELFEKARQHDDYWAEGLIIDFTEELARWMKEKKISRSELAARIGHSPAYITKVLRGNANFTATTMAKLAKAVGAEVRLHLASSESRTTWYDQATTRPHGAREEDEAELLEKSAAKRR